MKKLQEYLKNNSIEFKVKNNSILTIENFGSLLLIESKGCIIITSSFELNLSEEEKNTDVDYYCFQLGDNFYYTKKGEKLSLNILKYIGSYNSELNLKVPFLGLHGMYEILNGSRDYKDWIKKAKFLNIDTLGICEKNTLGGVLKFQLDCKKNNITSIIGEQVVVKDGDDLLQFKCYVKNEIGWKNLLSINKELNITNHGFIDKNAFLELHEGLFIVIDTKYTLYSKSFTYDLNIPELYYQIDTVEFSNDEKDKEYLLNLKEFLFQDKIKPVIISDAYYLDKEDSDAKNILNSISNVRDYKSDDQYLKTIDDNYNSLLSLFKDDNKFFDVFEKSINNILTIVNRCNFEIETKEKYLPRYIMTDKEKSKYTDRDTMFWSLIQKGLDSKGISDKKCDTEKYLDRIQEEYNVISKVKSKYGDGIDYFLMSWDIIRFCNKNNILVGLGRGSSAGSLLAYLLNITKVDPFDYGLLFSRFLNAGRIETGAIPDFDIDIQALRRNEVKHYLEEKYGFGNVCSIGTYTTLQLKAALKDIARQKNIEFGTVNYISQLLDIEDGNWEDIFVTANHKKQVKEFVLSNPDIIEDIQLILKQPKSPSVHACGMIVTPNELPINECIPTRLGEKDGETIIVSEWEGKELEIAGYLKEDILGITQLDKYAFIIDLIKKQTGDEIDIYNIPLIKEGVYDLFKNGYNGDIFHFGSRGLTGYCKELKPNNIHELIAAISLYRPGAMDVNAHNEYVLRKFKERDIKYHWRTENILKETYGLIVYQEQVMKIFQELADFDLVMADNIRRSLGKKEKDIIAKYKEQFISNIVNKGCDQGEAEIIWHELEVHARYSFNLSHATVYAITGYIGQWLKYHYPLQYWTSAFQFDDPNPKKSNIGRYISEIRKTDNFIKISSININESGETFTSNADNMELYWSISRVKQVGNVALNAIISERDKNGLFFSLEEFLSRVKKSEVNKAVVINLILSGAFDEIENIKFASERKKLIDAYYEFPGNKRDKDDIYLNDYKDYWWQIKQKEVSGFGEIDYNKVIDQHIKIDKKHIDGVDLENTANDTEVLVIGIIKNVDVRTTKKDDEYCNLDLDYNNEDIRVTIWSETFKNIDVDDLGIDSIFAMNGRIAEYKSTKSVHSFEKTEIYII